ncbi:hypothetical protein N5T95_09730 [Aliarcobacter cryaerophilus]|nr:hypothetical protein [Aliarcobacter cryaerophilus]
MELKYEKRSSYGRRTKKITYLKDMNLPLYMEYWIYSISIFEKFDDRYSTK